MATTLSIPTSLHNSRPHVPKLATLDDDGWSLDNAEERLRRGNGLYWLPDRWTRDHLEEHVPQGGFVKLLFRLADLDHTAEPAIERMWVSLDMRDDAFYHGHLANTPHTRSRAQQGMAVWFRAEHVIDYAGPDGENQASESADAVRCRNHGTSAKCYVCVHLTPDTEGRGFNFADLEALRPDAWCDECHHEFIKTHDWETAAVEPSIKIVCGGCYDTLKRRHAHAS